MKGFIQVKSLFNASIAKNALHSPLIYTNMKEFIQVKYHLNVGTVANDSNNQIVSIITNPLTVMKDHLNVRHVEKNSELIVICLNIGKFIKPNEKVYLIFTFFIFRHLR